MTRIRRLIEAWEATPLHPGAWLASLFAIALLRNLLEGLLESNHQWTVRLALRPGLVDQFHGALAWLCVYLLATLGLAPLRRASAAQVSRVTLRVFPLIMLVPLLDAILGQPGHIYYQSDFSAFLNSYAGLLIPGRPVPYVTTGVRVEIFLGALLAGGYVILMAENGRMWRALGAGLLLYHVPFLLGYLPALWSLVFRQTTEALAHRTALGVDAAEASLIWYLPILIPGLFWWIRSSSASAWIALRDCLRPSRLGIYLFLLNGGFLAATREGLVDWDWLNPYDIAEVLLMNLALVAAFISQVALNDLFDQDIDRQSNSTRPLASGQAMASTYVWLSGAGAVLALLLCMVIDEVAVYPMLGILALGWLYSAPPFRLRRFLGLAHLVLAAIAMGTYLLGSTLVHGNLAFRQCNRPLLGLIGLFFFAASHLKDLKDTEGDRNQNVITFATLLGERRAYWVSGTLVVLTAVYGMIMGILPRTPLVWLALGIFEAAWLILRNGERLIRVLGFVLAILLAGAVWPGRA